MLTSHLQRYSFFVLKELLCFVSYLIPTIKLYESELFQKSGFIDTLIELFITRALEKPEHIIYVLEVIQEYFGHVEYDIMHEILRIHIELIDCLIEELENSKDDVKSFFIVKVLKHIFGMFKEINEGDISKSAVLAEISSNEMFIDLLKDLERNSASKETDMLHKEIIDLITLLEIDAEVSIF